MAELKKEHQKAFNDKVRTLQGEIQELKVAAARETKDVAIKNKQALEDKERRHESIRVAIESEKKTEEKLHEKTKLDSSKQK